MKTRDLFLSLKPDARILFIRLRSMGDCLLLTSPLRALKHEFPGFHLWVLAEDRFAGCFDGNPDVERVLTFHSKSQALQLLTLRFDLVVNLHGGPTSLAYALMARGRHVGGEQFQYPWLYRGLFPAPEPTAHSVETTLATFRWLGLKTVDAPPLRFVPHSEEAIRVRTPLASPYAVIHPAAVMETKRWDASRFAELARKLQESGLTVVVTCGPGEEARADEVARQTPGCRVLSGLSIPELAELIRGARLYAGNDSGPMHLAAAVGTPILALWGSSDSRRWRPWKAAHAVVQNPFECNPCPGYRCLVAPTPLCIESVTVEQAVNAAQQLLRE